MNAQDIKDFRESNKLSQRALGRALNRTRDCVAKYESGKYSIPIRVDMIISDLKMMKII